MNGHGEPPILSQEQLFERARRSCTTYDQSLGARTLAAMNEEWQTASALAEKLGALHIRHVVGAGIFLALSGHIQASVNSRHWRFRRVPASPAVARG